MIPSLMDPSSGRLDGASPASGRTAPRPRSSLFGTEPGFDRRAALAAAGGRESERRPSKHGRPSRRDKAVGIALGVALVLAALALPRIGALRAAPKAPASGTLVVESQPAGWHVWDGEID